MSNVECRHEALQRANMKPAHFEDDEDIELLTINIQFVVPTEDKSSGDILRLRADFLDGLYHYAVAHGFSVSGDGGGVSMFVKRSYDTTSASQRDKYGVKPTT